MLVTRDSEETDKALMALASGENGEEEPELLGDLDEDELLR